MSNTPNRHVARWIPLNTNLARLVCLCCGEIVGGDIIGGSSSTIVRFGVCDATVEQRADTLDEVIDIMVRQSGDSWPNDWEIAVEGISPEICNAPIIRMVQTDA